MADKDVVENAEQLRNKLLDPVECLEKAFDATSDGAWSSSKGRAIT